VTEPTTAAWWVHDRPEQSGPAVEERLPAVRAVAVTTRLPDGDGPPDLVLIPARPAPRAVVGLAVRPGLPRRGVLVGVLAGAAALLLLGLATRGLVAALHPDRQGVPTGTSDGSGARVLPVDPAGVTVSASSTQHDDGDISYTAANTLDGDPATAWNSDGARDGKGPGMTLTYTVAAPIELHSISVLNGYQKVRPRPGRSALDLYPLNARVQRLRVVTDAGAWFWDLADTRSAQTFTRAAGRTGRVRLEIVSVYPSATYPDVALSEVSFTSSLPR